MQKKTVFIAHDGRQFDSESECKIYEEVFEHRKCLSLCPSDIAAALTGDNTDIGDEIEKLGNRIAKNRIARGGAKRARKPVVEPMKEAAE
jgi:hypothetical protein